ncbi:HNH endonuclease family protein [uncultured Campylobacter sp.]|uniref:HNH endonuclease family protein n=1 Tax=uncultured Campylobacter sp. TaxID=218934 RepID=UPI002615BBF4|nr:HNH endonuclease family protein [uncultured Campylobacter sp.]
MKKNLKEGLLDCLEYFKIRIKEIDDVFDFLKFITDKSKLFVKVNLESTEDEQKIFDSINSTGMPLNATDIIKNALFDRIIKISDEEYALDLYDKYWRNIFEHDDKCLQFWDSQITTGRIKRSQSEIFLHAFALIIGIFDTDKHSLSDLSSVFKIYIQNKSREELKDFLVLLAMYAQAYQKLPQITQDILFDFDEYENRFFHLGYCFGINSFLPLVLFLKQNLEEDEYKKAFYLLEMTILCVSETKNYNKFVADIISNLQNDLKNTYIYIRDQIKKYYVKFFERSQIEEWLNNIENNDAKVILFWIELYRQRETKDYKDKTGLYYVYTLEHLAPQKWQENWNNIFESEEEADKFIYKIGNMTLLKGKFNTALQNATWAYKLNGDDKSKHYIKKYADLTINKELLDIEQWNKATIERRSKELADDFYKIWDVNIFLKEKQ